MKLIKYILVFLILSGTLPGELPEEQSVKLRWKPVRGSRGYLIEFRGEGIVKQKKVRVNQVSLKLKAGSYRIRVAGLNKFGKPGIWSDWKPMVLSKRRKQQTQQILDLEKIKQPPPVVSRPGKKETGKVSLWKILTPGYIRLEKRDYLRGFAWPGLMLFGGLYALDQARRAENHVNSLPGNDAALASFAWVNSFTLGIILREARIERAKEYNKRVQGRNLGLGLLALGYTLHFGEYFYFIAGPGQARLGFQIRF